MDNEIENELQVVVRAVMQKYRFSEKKLADAVGVSQIAIHRYKTGKSKKVEIPVWNRLLKLHQEQAN